MFSVQILWLHRAHPWFNKKCFWNMYAKLKCHLDLWPRNPKFSGGHLLVMTKHHTKLEDPRAMSSVVIDRTRFVYGPTDRQTEWRTCAKQYTPTPLNLMKIRLFSMILNTMQFIILWVSRLSYVHVLLHTNKSNNLFDIIIFILSLDI